MEKSLDSRVVLISGKVSERKGTFDEIYYHTDIHQAIDGMKLHTVDIYNPSKEFVEELSKYICAAPMVTDTIEQLKQDKKELLEALQGVLFMLGNYDDMHVSDQKKYLTAEKAILNALNK